MSGGQQREMDDMGRPDMVNRDPNDLNAHIKVSWEEVFGEPEGVHSIDCLWRNAYKCFTCGKNLCYMILTTLCGLCIALAWGCNFALTAFHHVWCYTPCMREFSIMVGCWRRAYGTIINCCLGPLCETCGLCFSNIMVKNA